MTAPGGGLTPGMIEVLTRATEPDYARWSALARSVAGCTQPVRLIGSATTVDVRTGEILDSYATSDEPTGYVLTRCGNRRASVCPSCAEIYRADTFQLIRAGLSGGKGVPETVRAHPRLFVTLTAPSFGAVHSHRESGGRIQPCRTRRAHPVCDHGRPVWCDERHSPADSRRGKPLCPECFDYTGAVLWNAHVGKLWTRFTIYVRRRLAALAGLGRGELSRAVRLSFAKVVEYQARGLIHVHALVRIDGPEGPDDMPPTWATPDLLATAVREAARAVTVPLEAPGISTTELRWGDQLDSRELPAYTGSDDQDEKVAGYVAKYATKGAEVAGTVDHRIHSLRDLDGLTIDPHARRLITTCWELGSVPELGSLRLRHWAHMLGFRGHFGTRSRRYSTTLTALRQARTDERAERSRELRGLPEPDAEQSERVGAWRYAGRGYSAGHALIAGMPEPDSLAG